MTVDWTAHQAVKMIYVCHPILAMETGHANWFSMLDAEVAKPEKPIPLARISNESTSTGYRACSGVKPIEYTAPKMKMKARHAVPAALLVPVVAPSGIDSWYRAAETVMASQTRQQPMFEKRRSGRRPTRSTRLAPKSAKQNCWQLLMRMTFACPVLPSIPIVSRTLDMKYESTELPAHWPKTLMQTLQKSR